MITTQENPARIINFSSKNINIRTLKNKVNQGIHINASNYHELTLKKYRSKSKHLESYPSKNPCIGSKPSLIAILLHKLGEILGDSMDGRTHVSKA